MAKPVRRCCVHGVTVNEGVSGWRPGCTQAVPGGFRQADSELQIEPTSLRYNDSDGYKPGVTSHGAFTYSLARILRRIARRDRPPTFAGRVKLTAKNLSALSYDQHPVVLEPRAVTSPVVALGHGGRRSKPPARRTGVLVGVHA